MKPARFTGRVIQWPTSAHFRLKDVPHQWILRNRDPGRNSRKYAKLPIVPLVAVADKAARDPVPSGGRLPRPFVSLDTDSRKTS
jgi:hypothetical protein